MNKFNFSIFIFKNEFSFCSTQSCLEVIIFKSMGNQRQLEIQLQCVACAKTLNSNHQGVQPLSPLIAFVHDPFRYFFPFGSCKVVARQIRIDSLLYIYTSSLISRDHDPLQILLPFVARKIRIDFLPYIYTYDMMFHNTVKYIYF